MRGSPSPGASQQKLLSNSKSPKFSDFLLNRRNLGADQEFDDAMNEARSCIAAKLSHRNHTEERPFLEEICHPGRYGRVS
ncbi:hypothetical protein CEXT_638971 [Caerostris extrusa]|uniref:Uncharacterized protein n=1 Tax=Caerostris extrusa TaxID=172846 RepID=A0AAV4R2K6_CAEEX|nr:hypothetical protein CEXT_638971 [Caerostris extrusa]